MDGEQKSLPTPGRAQGDARASSSAVSTDSSEQKFLSKESDRVTASQESPQLSFTLAHKMFPKSDSCISDEPMVQDPSAKRGYQSISRRHSSNTVVPVGGEAHLQTQAKKTLVREQWLSSWVRNARRTLYNFTEDSHSSPYAAAWQAFQVVAVAVSLTFMFMESMDGPNKGSTAPTYPYLPSAQTYYIVYAITSILLTVDLLLRFLAAEVYFGSWVAYLFRSAKTEVQSVWTRKDDDPKKDEQGEETLLFYGEPFFSRFFTWTDILALLPFYVPLMTSHDCYFVVYLKILRMFRVFPVIRNWTGWRILVAAIKNSAQPLVIPVVFFFMIVILCGPLLYTLDPCIAPDFCVFPNMFHSSYFTIVTITTVGYGDVVPSRWPARVVTMMVMLIGSLFLSMPIAVIGNEFHDAWVRESDRSSTIHLAQRGRRQRNQLRGSTYQTSALGNDSAISRGDPNKKLEMSRLHDYVCDEYIAITNQLCTVLDLLHLAERFAYLGDLGSMASSIHQTPEKLRDRLDDEMETLLQRHRNIISDIKFLDPPASLFSIQSAVAVKRGLAKFLDIRRRKQQQKSSSGEMEKVKETGLQKPEARQLDLYQRMQIRGAQLNRHYSAEEYQRLTSVTGWKDKLWLMLEIPSSSSFAKSFYYIYLVAVVFSVVVVFVESMAGAKAFHEGSAGCEIEVYHHCQVYGKLLDQPYSQKSSVTSLALEERTIWSDPACFVFEDDPSAVPRPLRYFCNEEDCYGQGKNFGSRIPNESLSCEWGPPPFRTLTGRFDYRLCDSYSCNNKHEQTIKYNQEWLELFFVSFFSLEVLGRLIAAPSAREWVISPVALIDLISVLPFYLEMLAFVAPPFIRVPLMLSRPWLKLLRVVRLLKLARHYSGTHVLWKTFKMCRKQLTVPLVLLVSLVVVLAGLMWEIEGGTECFVGQPCEAEVPEEAMSLPNNTRFLVSAAGRLTDFADLPTAYWFVLVTVTTTGYGDVVPVTPLGKLLAAFIMIIGVTYTAMPLTLVGVRYYACYKEQKEREFVAYKKAMGEDLERLQLESHEIELCRSYINVRAQIKQARQHVKDAFVEFDESAFISTESGFSSLQSSDGPEHALGTISEGDVADSCASESQEDESESISDLSVSPSSADTESSSRSSRSASRSSNSARSRDRSLSMRYVPRSTETPLRRPTDSAFVQSSALMALRTVEEGSHDEVDDLLSATEGPLFPRSAAGLTGGGADPPVEKTQMSLDRAPETRGSSEASAPPGAAASGISLPTRTAGRMSLVTQASIVAPAERFSTSKSLSSSSLAAVAEAASTSSSSSIKFAGSSEGDCSELVVVQDEIDKALNLIETCRNVHFMAGRVIQAVRREGVRIARTRKFARAGV